MTNLSNNVIFSEIIEYYKNNKLDILHKLSNKSKCYIYINDKSIEYPIYFSFDSSMKYMYIKSDYIFNYGIEVDTIDGYKIYGLKYKEFNFFNVKL